MQWYFYTLPRGGVMNPPSHWEKIPPPQFLLLPNVLKCQFAFRACLHPPNIFLYPPNFKFLEMTLQKYSFNCIFHLHFLGCKRKIGQTRGFSQKYTLDWSLCLVSDDMTRFFTLLGAILHFVDLSSPTQFTFQFTFSDISDLMDNPNLLDSENVPPILNFHQFGTFPA